MVSLKRTYCALKFGTAAAAALLFVASTALADDIDIYAVPAADGMRPNVLIIIDNTANWGANINTAPCDLAAANVKPNSPNKEDGTKWGAQKCALYKLIHSMSVADLSQFNLGFMMFNESPNSSGYPRQAFITITDLAQKQALLDKIAAIGINSDKTNNASTAETFYEAFLYFNGDAVRNGARTSGKVDPHAFTDASRTRYRGPGVGCSKNHIIYIANGSPSDNDGTAFTLLQRLNPSATRTKIPAAENVSNSDEANWADEFAAFFNRGADLSAATEGQQNIQVHTIAVTGASSDGNYPNFVRWIAKEGGGLYQEARDSATIIGAISKVLNQIRSVNSVFSSASLPISANTQGTYLNQVYIGMFRPDGNAKQRWVGNLKQFQFLYNAQLDTLQMGDANGQPAISPTTGFIQSDSVSYWTQPSEFWIKAEETSDGKYKRSDLPDGDVVEKGGAAQWLRSTYLTGSTGRPLYTCPGSCLPGTNLVAAGLAYQFSSSNVLLTPAMFGYGALETTKRDLLINWVRGDENVLATNVANDSAARDQLAPPPDGATVRASIHGDVLHSRPVAINYGGSRGIVVFYGSNDGVLRALNGNKTGNNAGAEMWGFIAPEHFGRLERLRENDPEVRYPTTIGSPTARARDYFFDGPIGFYQNTIAGEVMIFAGMRRGGRSVYAFNVSNPDSPSIMWTISPSFGGYGQLGQTWSMPKVTPIKGRADPVLIMGGGYDDGAEDPMPSAATTRGTGVYVINMRTGARLAHLPTDFSVPSDAALIDIDGDGFVDRIYVVDVRAQLYRIDIEDTDGHPRDPTLWRVTKLAALNTGADGISGNRKAFFSPDVVVTRDYMTILLGTGDREHPLLTSTNDRFYVIKDPKVTKGEPESVTVIKDAQLTQIASGANAADDPEGCYYQLETNGEKVINQPITFGGLTYFSTNRPFSDPKACSRAQSRAYAMPLVCKSPSYRNLIGDGLPPSPVVGYVDVGGGKLVPFVIGGPNDKASAIEAQRAQILVPGKRKRAYWYIENRDR